MDINDGDFIKINLTGKVKDTDEIISTTYEEIAREAGIYNENVYYGPTTVVLGGGHILPIVEDAIKESEIGDKLTVNAPCEDVFGPRNPKLVQVVSLKEFRKTGLNPYPGLKFKNADGYPGKVLTVNGGRVKVDFNNEFAGKDIVYDVEFIEIVEDFDEKIKGLISLRYHNPNTDLDKMEISLEDGILSIILDKLSKFDQNSYMNVSLSRFEISKDIINNIDDVEKVHFIDEFEVNDNSVDDDEEIIDESSNAGGDESSSAEENTE